MNIVSRHLGWDIYEYNWDIGLVMLSIISFLYSKGIARSLSLWAMFIFAGLAIDKAQFNKFYFQLNDTISIIIATIIAIIHQVKSNDYAFKIEYLIIPVLVAIKIITNCAIDSNEYLLVVHFFRESRSYLELGDSLAYLIFAIYIARQMWPLFNVPVYLITLTYINFQKYLTGDPYSFGWHEIAILVLVSWTLIATRKLINSIRFQRP